MNTPYELFSEQFKIGAIYSYLDMKFNSVSIETLKDYYLMYLMGGEL